MQQSAKGWSTVKGARNAAMEEIIHMLHNFGISETFPAWQRELDTATTATLAEKDTATDNTQYATLDGQRIVLKDGKTPQLKEEDYTLQFGESFGVLSKNLEWFDFGKFNEKTKTYISATKDNTTDDGDLPRSDLDDEYFADAVESYFNMRGGEGYVRKNTVCVSRNCGSSTSHQKLKDNHKAMYDLVKKMFGDSADFK